MLGDDSDDDNEPDSNQNVDYTSHLPAPISAREAANLIIPIEYRIL